MAHHRDQGVEGEGVAHHQAVGVGVEHLPLADHYRRHHLPVWFSTMRVRNRAYNVREKRAKEEEERKK